jgi:hypothetical protein
MNTKFLVLIQGEGHYLTLCQVTKKLSEHARFGKLLVHHLVIDENTSFRQMSEAEKGALLRSADEVSRDIPIRNCNIKVSDLIQFTSENDHPEQMAGEVFLGDWTNGERFVFDRVKWSFRVGTSSYSRTGLPLYGHRPYFANARDLFPEASWD